jgi:hypothetical protein
MKLSLGLLLSLLHTVSVCAVTYFVYTHNYFKSVSYNLCITLLVFKNMLQHSVQKFVNSDDVIQKFNMTHLKWIIQTTLQVIAHTNTGAWQVM